MDYSIEDIREECIKVKSEIQALESQIEILERFKKQGKKTDEIIKQKEIEKLDKLDVLLGIQEYCNEKIEENKQKNTNALSVINNLKQSYDYLDKQYKFKPKRIKDQMENLEKQMKEATKNIEIQNLPNLKEQEQLEKLGKEIIQFIENQKKENKEVNKNDNNKEKKVSSEYINEPKTENKEVNEKTDKKEKAATSEDVLKDFNRDTVEQFNEQEKPVSDEELQKYLFGGKNPIKAEIEKEKKPKNNTLEGTDISEIEKKLDTHNAEPKKIKPLSPITEKEINVSNPKETTEEIQEDIDKMAEVYTRIKEKKNQSQPIEESKKEVVITRNQYNDILRYLGKEDKIDGKVKRKVPKEEHEKKKKSTLKRLFNFFVQEIEVENNEEIDYDRRKSL